MNEGQGFDVSTGTFTVPEAGIYLFGLKATSGSGKDWTRINAYRDDIVSTSITEGNGKDVWNNLSATWITGYSKGSKIRLKVEHNNVDDYILWWGVRISER